MLLRDGAIERVGLARPFERAGGRAVDAADDVLDGLEVARIAARPLLQAPHERRARVDLADGAHHVDDLVARDARLLARDDARADLMHLREHAVVQLRPPRRLTLQLKKRAHYGGQPVQLSIHRTVGGTPTQISTKCRIFMYLRM